MADPLVEQKVESLRRCIVRIEEKRPASCGDLERDIDAQDIIAINLERAVQQCVDAAMIVLSNIDAQVPATMGEAFDELTARGIIDEALCKSMQGAVGFRNLLVHAYRKIDWRIVWRIITDNLDDFRRFAAEILRLS